MDLVTGAMGALPAKVLQLLKDEYDLQAGVKEDVQSLSKELESIHATLSTVAKVPPDKLDALDKLWARDCREASYDIEDILDSFLVRVDGDPQPAVPDRARRRRLRSKMAELFCLGKVKARRDIATAIVGFRKQLEEMKKRHRRYHPLVVHLVPAIPDAAATSIDPRTEALYRKASDLIGIDEPRDTLIKMLSLGAEDPMYKDKLKIVSIFGSGGLGKTTVAKAAYDSVNLEFDCCAFVQVGQYPTPKKVLKDVLVKLTIDERKKAANGYDNGLYTGADLIGLEAEDLIGQLRQFLQGKRYFIVVDDIWDSGTWENIKLAFVDSDNGSRVVITSRNYQVSAKIGNQVFRINKLSDDNSRKLFYKRISGKEGDKGDDTDKISDKIIRKCHGVPLAIIAVASALATKPRDEWPDVYKSIGFGHENNTEANNMKKILLFSYYDLPCHLRACMLYLSVFPEDYYVDKNMLIWRWIAEGLVHTENGKGPFEVGESYFHELINRGLILQEEIECVLMGCRVHDFVVGLVRALASEENFVAILDSEQPSLSLPRGKVRRLALQDLWDRKHSWTIQVDDICIPEARSFHSIICQSHLIPPVAAFKFLRLLALEHCLPKEGYLEHIGKLLHLRYLGLHYTPVRKLPEDVGNLKFLQTLQLKGTGIEALPASLEQCTGLMCLHADNKTRVPDWIGELTSLVELQVFPGAAGESFVKELCKLTNLRRLRVYIDLQDQGRARDLLESLSKLENIEVVNVYSTSSQGLVLRTEGAMQLPGLLRGFKNLRLFAIRVLQFPWIPAWLTKSNFPVLNHLEINLGDVRQEDMEILGSFPHLQYLDLHTSTHILGNVHVAEERLFQSLVTFVCPWPCITFVEGAMPRLEHIYLDIFVAMAMEENRVLDFGLGNLCSLQRVTAKIRYSYCFPEEVEEVEAAIRHQVGIHPNRPTIQTIKFGEDNMVMTESGLLQRLLLREELIVGRVTELVRLFSQWYKTTNGDSYCINDAMHKRDRFRDLTYDIIQCVFFGRILWRGELGDGEAEGHRNYEQESARFNEQVGTKYQQLISLQPDRDVRQVVDNIAALAKVHDGLAVEIPRMVSMWEELKAELSQQAPEEDAGNDHDSPHVSDASPVVGRG